MNWTVAARLRDSMMRLTLNADCFYEVIVIYCHNSTDPDTKNINNGSKFCDTIIQQL